MSGGTFGFPRGRPGRPWPKGNSAAAGLPKSWFQVTWGLYNALGEECGYADYEYAVVRLAGIYLYSHLANIGGFYPYDDQQ